MMQWHSIYIYYDKEFLHLQATKASSQTQLSTVAWLFQKPTIKGKALKNMTCEGCGSLNWNSLVFNEID